ncbi:MAG: hypothetical protein WCR08_00805 [Gammaproteobacteria bacterium]|jgi:hypothetical protein|nr:hypothetical protein [Gammaproteobacteria bacterium]
MKPILYLSILVLSSSVFAITTVPPNGDSIDVNDLQDVYYPPVQHEQTNPQVATQPDPETSTPTTD